MGRFGLTLLAILAGGAAQALTCTFETECFEQDGCMESGFGLQVSTGEEDALVFETEFGDLNVIWSMEDMGAFAGLAEGAGARYFLTSGPEAARLTVHLDGPTAVTYIGQCEGGI